jgi:hypothetical protein
LKYNSKHSEKDSKAAVIGFIQWSNMFVEDAIYQDLKELSQ